ncbi:maleylacetoacetate isomerase [Gilvimarinus sp. F26214L]|uniref:maleylacetoacetate isomerase n=1 Tax=Gilvimarinus sp. DZF01 TaxID=3461371 RepID=UPI0040457BE1
MKLYSYFRSSAAYRMRIALNLKGLDYETVPVSLIKGEQQSDDYLERNPQGLVPALELDDGSILTQSMAMCEYLEEQYPQPPLLPKAATDRARVRAIANMIACDIHPLNNLRVLKYLTGHLHDAEENKLEWYRHWVNTGFNALEKVLANGNHTGEFCHGDQPGLADVFLVPQVYNAQRYDCDLKPFPYIARIAARCQTLPEFAKAHPDNQPDAAAK